MPPPCGAVPPRTGRSRATSRWPAHGGRARGPAGIAGAPLDAAWRVEAVVLVSSVLGGRGARRYETVATVALPRRDVGAARGHESDPPPARRFGLDNIQVAVYVHQ